MYDCVDVKSDDFEESEKLICGKRKWWVDDLL